MSAILGYLQFLAVDLRDIESDNCSAFISRGVFNFPTHATYTDSSFFKLNSTHDMKSLVGNPPQLRQYNPNPQRFFRDDFSTALLMMRANVSFVRTIL